MMKNWSHVKSHMEKRKSNQEQAELLEKRSFQKNIGGKQGRIFSYFQ